MTTYLSIDIETFSSVDIKKSGLYKYVQSPDFEILLFAYAYNDEPVQIVDLAQGETLPEQVIQDLNNPEVVKTAYNAAFEYYALSKFYQTSIEQWRCTMILGAYFGYPFGLEAICKVLGLEEDKKKMAVGKALIKYFCCPVKPTKTNGGRTRNYPKHDLEKWELFKDYCKRDVVAEREVKNHFSLELFPGEEHRLWCIDQAINQRGVLVDKQLVEGALFINDLVSEEIRKEMRLLTGLDNPNSVSQLKDWVTKQLGYNISGLGKEQIDNMLKWEDVRENKKLKKVLELRKKGSKSSISKYQAMAEGMCSDNRVRGLLQFYGTKTGRWAGRLVQVQNLPRNYMETLDLARGMLKERQKIFFDLMYPNVPDSISQLIRTAFIPSDGNVFLVADFSAIEARVLSWLAGEEWRLQVFRTHGKIYEASASAMFGVPIEKIQKGNPEYELRQKGKIAELALGYQGGVGALTSMGALNMGLTEEELPDIVKRWRTSNRRIVDFWYSVEERAKATVEHGVSTHHPCGISFHRTPDSLMIQLPSGRHLFYVNPRLERNERGGQSLWYDGLDQGSKNWNAIQTYGGKLTENIVQAVARDCLANALFHLEWNDYPVVMHIHDECVIEVEKNSGKTLEKAIELMCINPSWASGLPLAADGFETSYYKKD